MSLKTAASLALVGFLLMAGCGSVHRSVSVTRLVSLAPSATEIVFALGAGPQLVGVTNQCDYPDSVRSRSRVGDFAAPDIERVVALKPSLVFLVLPLHQRVAERLGEMGIPYHSSNPTTLEEVLIDIERIGRLVGRTRSGVDLVAAIRRRLDNLPSDIDTPSVYVEISSVPLMTVGGSSFVSDLIRCAGGRNIFADIGRAYPSVDPEQVVVKAPDVIILLHRGTVAAEVRQRTGWGGIPAVRNREVYDDIDENLLLRPGPRVVDGVERLARRLHQGS